MLLTQFLVVLLDTSTVLALPEIQRQVGFSARSLQWVQTSYMIAFGGPLLLAGRCADIFGRRLMLVSGLALFTAASALCGLAASPAVLVAGRALQGVASAFASAAALSIITVTFTRGPERNVALGSWGLVSGLSASVGLLLGGTLTEWLGWNAVFLSLLPFSVLALVASLRLVPAYHGDHGSVPLDVLGALLGTGTVVALVFGVAESTTYGWRSIPVTAGVVASLVLGLAFVAQERRAAAPMLPPAALRTGNVGAGSVATFVFGAILLAVLALTSVYLQNGRALSPVACGLAMLPTGAMSLLLSVHASHLVGRFGVRAVLASGLGVLGAGCGALAAVGGSGSIVATFVPAGVLFGAGIAGTEVASMITSTDDLGHGELAGLASGLWSTALQVGGAVGLAVLATVMADATAGHGQAVVISGYRDAALVACGLGLAGAVFVLCAVRRRVLPGFS